MCKCYGGMAVGGDLPVNNKQLVELVTLLLGKNHAQLVIIYLLLVSSSACSYTIVRVLWAVLWSGMVHSYFNKIAVFFIGKSIDVNTLLNCVPILSSKWSLIGRMLELPVSVINNIADAHKSLSHSKYQYQSVCCAAMLIEWLNIQKDVTPEHFFQVMEYSSVNFSCDEIAELKSIMSSSFKTISTNPVFCKTEPPKVPNEHERKFTKMIFNVLRSLRNSHRDFYEVLDELSFSHENMDSLLLQNVTDWKSLIQSFRKNNLITLFDVDWLEYLAEDVADCPEAVEVINNYRKDIGSFQLVDKIHWEEIPNGCNKEIIQTTSSELPQNINCQHIHQAKSVTVELLQCKKIDLLPNTASVGSVSYNWKISTGLRFTIKIPKSASQKLKNLCDNLSITQITIIVGQSKEVIIINQLLVEVDAPVVVVNDKLTPYPMLEPSSCKDLIVRAHTLLYCIV